MAFVEDQVEVLSDEVTFNDVRPKSAKVIADEDEIIAELGIWLSGLESFLASGRHSFAGTRDSASLPDSRTEFRLVHTTLQRCLMLNARLLSGNGATAAVGASLTQEIKFSDLSGLSLVLRELTVLSEGLIHSDKLGSGEWRAWSNLLSNRFSSLPACTKLIGFAEDAGRKFLPGPLIELVENKGFLTAEHAELALILPRFGIVLRWLSVVGKMLEADEALKPALLLFARINEQIFDLTSYINNRLERFPSEEAELFSSLDAASYTASIELKKVYTQELAGIARMRPSPSIYARIETAHSLLYEGFQQILAGFARILDPATDVFELFPNFQVKREQSIVLRKELRKIVAAVQTAEANPDKKTIDKMQADLREFMKGTVGFLFFKDTETVDRFVEEILITKQNKDLVPILHRFGAYLETLFGQVNLRAVLVTRPFESEPPA